MVVPVDITGSIISEYLKMSVGFDTITKVCGQIVGNNATDGKSAKKYYYFMRIMGQSPSHTTQEVALLTKPNFVILSEEVIARRMTLMDVVNSIADVVEARASVGKNYGTVLIPEGLICAIPEMCILVQDIDRVYNLIQAPGFIRDESKSFEDEVMSKMTLWNRALLQTLPSFMISELINERLYQCCPIVVSNASLMK